MGTTRLGIATAAFALAAILPSGRADAFCGFYVGGADARLTNNATMVVLMRQGTRTALSMQNDYQGPPSDFALVVPVPTVLQQENVRTLSREVFDRIDQLASPRLVEYWEQDPCGSRHRDEEGAMGEESSKKTLNRWGLEGPRDFGVVVEAQFAVGEYDIVILSANDSSGLEAWLRHERYNIPAGASDALRPYIEQGTKFFVAKVNVERVTFRDGRAVLSPLRVHYDDERFSLPVRLGLLNSAGTQDLIVHILAPDQRYETANYPNVTIPTNLDVANEVRERFSEFYASLFDRTVAVHRGAVVTEYAWQANNCDPCPGPVLGTGDFRTMGGDVMPNADDPGFGQDFVLTRLHYRYGRNGLDEDLVFRTAPPIVGGREVMRGTELEHGVAPDSSNNFQARYAIRHPWTGPITCSDPERGRWGGPLDSAGESAHVRPARDLAMAPRGRLRLASVLRTDAPEIRIHAALPSVSQLLTPRAHAQAPAAPSGCACSIGARGSSRFALALVVALALLWRRSSSLALRRGSPDAQLRAQRRGTPVVRQRAVRTGIGRIHERPA